MSDEKALTVALVTSHLIEAEEYPEEPCVILTGSKEAVKEAGRHFDTAVSIIPQADLAAKDAEIARLRGLLWHAWYEFNAIRARSGSPLSHDGMELVSCEWWSTMTDAFGDAIGENAQTPWPSREAKAALPPKGAPDA